MLCGRRWLREKEAFSKVPSTFDEGKITLETEVHRSGSHRRRGGGEYSFFHAYVYAYEYHDVQRPVNPSTINRSPLLRFDIRGDQLELEDGTNLPATKYIIVPFRHSTVPGAEVLFKKRQHSYFCRCVPPLRSFGSTAAFEVCRRYFAGSFQRERESSGTETF